MVISSTLSIKEVSENTADTGVEGYARIFSFRLRDFIRHVYFLPRVNRTHGVVLRRFFPPIWIVGSEFYGAAILLCTYCLKPIVDLLKRI